ncbi:MAG TPA: NAD-dependent epimerase/dehydratase family protein [Saprospiraceae bacterium]|nr:NAD-dependent epimerase/dehydratase family protein [Saprospiraceae bacterium]
MTEKILITGGCGFVGSSLAISLKNTHPDWDIIAMDNLKRRGSELNLIRLRKANVIFIHGDIRIIEDFDQAGEPTCIIDCAAEPSVVAGISSSPDYVIQTNLQGTLNCLKMASRYHSKFIFLSTSRVYPYRALRRIGYREDISRFSILDQQEMIGISPLGISENFPISGPRSFYGATKLASEMIIEEYAAFYGLKTIINRCGIITGPWQMGKVDQGVIVLWMARHYWKGNLNYQGYGGSGKQVRDILHVDDLFALVLEQIVHFSKYNHGIFNVGGGSPLSLSLMELTEWCHEITGNRLEIGGIEETGPADIPVYITDHTKFTELSQWIPKKSVKDILEDIYDWIHSNENELSVILNR